MRCRGATCANFCIELGVFFVIAGCLLMLNVLQRWLVETLELKLREGLVHSLLEDWMQPRRAFWLANAGAIGVNPDQRMHEDARQLTELSADLGIGLLQASILFGTFAGVLWGLSSAVQLPHRRHATTPFPASWCGRRSSTRAPARC